LSDCEEISRSLAEGLPYKEIGRLLGRDSSVISGEAGRHGGRERYRAAAADEAARAARERPKGFAVERSPRLRAVVRAQLRDGWSPASIAGRLPVEYVADESCRVSHEAIYPTGVRAAGVHSGQRADSTAHRAHGPYRRASSAAGAADPRAVYIDARPAEVEGREVPGHWEGDRATRKVAREEWLHRLEAQLDEGVTRSSVRKGRPRLGVRHG
jgi:IS30 family transposase